MAENKKYKRKIYFTKGTGKIYDKNLKDPIVDPGKFSKRTRGTKCKIVTNN